MGNDIAAVDTVMLYNDDGVKGIHMHGVPRSLFDLIPGDPVEHDLGIRKFWTKYWMLAGEPGQHVTMTVYCDEAAPAKYGFPLEARGNDDETLLRESEPENLTGENG